MIAIQKVVKIIFDILNKSLIVNLDNANNTGLKQSYNVLELIEMSCTNVSVTMIKN